ncbi:sugar ABC transporter substrate-binding protein [Rossellomorea marisflavi]|uniref:ABC transporter substrate-binding protein n=1 Tax=Rossellomorea marisflavi TaxID=189381 RepID=UPI0025CAA902|nr:sugar ABC transporter substrate-binding protein [Rossellomorea marisflavi]GLI84086.1 sugar ABC transporter substrate-binding protein [Rossellomorea marisflavi]
MKWKLPILLGLILALGAAVYFSIEPIFNEGGKEVATAPKHTPEIILNFWRNKGTALENQAYEELVKTFNEEHPTIEVKMTQITYEDYELKLRTAIAAGNPPDIMTIDTPTLALYASAGALSSIDDYMRKEGQIEDLAEPTLKGLKYKGDIYLSPIAESSVGLFYNIRLFEKAGVPLPSKDPDDPMTWDEVVEAASRISALSDEIIGIDPAQGFTEGESPAYYKMPLIWQFGGEIMDPHNRTAEGYLNSPESLKALQFFQDMYQKQGIAQVEMPPDAFQNDLLGMIVQGSWMTESYEQDDPQFRLGKEYGITSLPKGVQRVVPNGGWALGLSSKAAHPDEAWEFIRYATSYEGSRRYIEITGDVPARYSVTQSFPELKDYPKNIFVHQAQEYSRNRPVTSAYPVVSEAIRILFEDIGIANKDVGTAADEAVEKIEDGIKDMGE